jgi:hypothetical protein
MLTGVIGPPRSDWMTGRQLAPGRAGGPQGRMHRNQPTAVLLGRAVAQFDRLTDFAGRAQDHLPGQLCDLASTQASFERQQQD